MRKDAIIRTIILLGCLLLAFSAAAEEQIPDQLTCEDWTWEELNVNYLTGDMDLSDYLGREITLSMKAEFKPASLQTESCKPLFVIVNGKRITMLKQSDTIIITPDEENKGVHFEGSIKMPDGIHLQEVRITLSASEGEKALKSVDTVFSLYDGSEGQGRSVFYIPYDIKQISIIIAAAAAAVWVITVIGFTVYKKRNRS